MEQFLKIPKIDEWVRWNNTDQTYIIGTNGTGKTLLLYSMMDWCQKHDYSFIHYDAMEAIYESEELFKSASDANISLACRIMGDFLPDFQRDIEKWARAEDFDKDPPTFEACLKNTKLLRSVLSKSGAGHTRFCVITLKAIQNPLANYYFLDMPETSIHIVVTREIIKYIMSHFEFMKIVVVTHAPEVLASTGVFQDNNHEILIDLPSAYIDNYVEEMA